MRDARAEVEGGAEVAEDLAPEGEGEGVFVFGWVVLGVFAAAAALSAVAYPPPENPGCDDHEDGHGVEQSRLEAGGGFGVDSCGWIGEFGGVEEGDGGGEMGG